jgi:hypothetical protein
MIFAALMIAHLLANFSFQTDKLAEKKQKEFAALLKHGLIYTITMLVTLLLTVQTTKMWLPFLLLAVSHFMIDYIRVQVQKTKFGSRYEVWLFIADQLLHTAVIFVIVACFELRANPTALAQWAVAQLTEPHASCLMRYLLLLILLLDPASIFIKQLFASIETSKQTKQQNNGIFLAATAKEARAGQAIGKLERLLVATLVITNQLSAIGFVMTAKSLARYKQLEEKDFAERYLVGTLASVAIAVIAALLLK